MTAILPIAHTWDGTPLPLAEHARIALSVVDGALRLVADAPWHGDPPPPGPPGPTDGLWEHEVLELFVSDGTRYTEIEIGPHGHHLVLRLDGVRQVVERLLPLELTTERRKGRWTAVATLHRRWLPERPRRCNAYRIHGTGADRRYHAHAPVPGPQPDFHRLEHFVPWPEKLGLY